VLRETDETPEIPAADSIPTLSVSEEFANPPILCVLWVWTSISELLPLDQFGQRACAGDDGFAADD